MLINIGKFKIESDKHQFVLSEIRKKGSFPGVYEAKEGETTDEVIGYYSTLISLLSALPSRALMRSDATTLIEVLAELKMYRQLILKLTEGA